MGVDRARQAVVIVHGMGEQRPMATATSFVRGLAQEHDLVYLAPDRVSQRQDLRRMKVTWLPRIRESPDDDAPLTPTRTDFYELYWANIVRGTEWRHVSGWLVSLMPRWRSVAPRLKKFLYHNFLPGLIGIAIAIALFFAAWKIDVAWQIGAVRLLSGALFAAASSWIIFHLGDVARYFNNVGDSVTIQRSIRSEGTELLRRLHEQIDPATNAPLYDRVVVVGHSLGSVVAYDIVRDYWTEVYRTYGTSADTAPESSALAEEVELLGENLPPRGEPQNPELRTAFRSAQRRLANSWQTFESPAPGECEVKRWAITDLVTLACPLTHADFLVAKGASALEADQWSRVLPTCPPKRQASRPTYRFGHESGGTDTRSWHQAAPFAPTRWTNVYFSSDVVGGPLSQLFGAGIEDIELAPPSGRAGRFPKVHSGYSREEPALKAIRRVIWDLGRRDDPATLEPAQLRTLMHIVREVLSCPESGQARAIATAPLLRKYSEVEQRRVRDVVRAVTARPDAPLDELVAAAVVAHPELLTKITLADSLLDDPA